MSVFRALLPDDYDDLPAAVCDFHDHAATHYRGTAFSGGAGNFPALVLRRIFGFPERADEMEVEIWLSTVAGRDRWDRRFGSRRFSSSFRPNSDGTLDEKFGPFRFAFRLRRDGKRMFWDFERWGIWGLGLPRFLGPRITTYETADDDGSFEFYSHADFPLIGRLVHYHGKVRPVPEA